MLLLEINEFNVDLLKLAQREMDLSAVSKFLSISQHETYTEEKEERFGLDPWVQWVSVHTGQPLAKHGIQHLGETPDLKHPQIWEKLDQAGVTTAVWGAMNSSQGKTKNNKFFFPDPWTNAEDAYPSELNDLLYFPRYFSQNYNNLSFSESFSSVLGLMKFCLKPKIFKTLLPISGTVIGSLMRYGPKSYLLFVLFDLVNVALFTKYYQKNKPQFAVLFLNSIAHLQHHVWRDPKGLTPEMRVAFKIFDQALELLFEKIGDDIPLVVANGFSQICSWEDREFGWRPRDPEAFLHAASISFIENHQLMTNDAHLYFSSKKDKMNAEKTLDDAKVDGKKLFHVDSSTDDLKLFYQVNYWGDLHEGARLTIAGKEFDFFQYFYKIGRRSGVHTPIGQVFTNTLELPPSFANHELSGYITRHFQCEA